MLALENATERTSSQPIDRRSDKRSIVVLDGTCGCVLNESVFCKTVDMSMSGIRLISALETLPDANITVSLATLSAFTGTVARVLNDGFAIDLSATPLEDFIDVALFARRTGLSKSEGDRAYPRIVAKHKLARVILRNGHETFVRISDVPRAGIALETAMLCGGDRVEVGNRPGVVVRTWQHGAAVKFDELIEPESLNSELAFR